MTEPSDSYYQALQATQHLHATTKKFNGRFLLRYAEEVEALIREFDCKTLLDYGCGKGVQWERPMPEGGFLAERLGVKVTKYDPGWPPFAAEPQGQFDIVVCTQVLGSIPIVDLPWILERIYGFASKAVYIGERIKPLRKQHLAHMADQMPHEWPHDRWAEALRSVTSSVPVILKTFDSIIGQARQERIW